MMQFHMELSSEEIDRISEVKGYLDLIIYLLSPIPNRALFSNFYIFVVFRIDSDLFSFSLALQSHLELVDL